MYNYVLYASNNQTLDLNNLGWYDEMPPDAPVGVCVGIVKKGSCRD